MKSTMQYSVGGNIIDVADDRRDEFLADYQKDYGEGEAPEEVYTFWVNGEPVQVKASRVAEFLADCEADGVQARRTRNFVMDDGQQLRLDDTAAANFVQARRSGMPMSRGLLKQTGIPEQYGRSAAEREALADLFAKLYTDDKGPDYEGEEYDVPRNLGDAVTDAARPIVENPAVQGFAEGLKRSVTDPAELYRETYGDGVITSALLGAQDFANTAVKGGMDVVAKAAGGQDTEAGRAIREAESALPTDQAEMGTDGSVTDTVLNFANDFSKNTLSTLMKYAAPGVAAVDIAGSVVDNYYDAYNRAIENGANADKANALASASAGIGAAEGIWLAQSASGGVAQNAVKGALKRIFSMGGKMGTAAGARDIVEQGIEGAENPDLVRAGKEALKGAAEGAAFEATSMGIHGLAGMDGSKRSTKKSVEAFRDDKAKQEARVEAKKNYDSRLSDEANADIDATVGEMIKNEVVPSWRQAEEVRQKAIEKLATREKGESHEAVEQAVMEAAQEVQARLQEPTRIETPALERRQTEAKMRENERWAKRSEELVNEYGEAEAAKRLEAEKAAEAAKGADDAAKKSEHDARKADIEAAFKEFTEPPVAKPDGKGKMVKPKPRANISEEQQKAVREDATMQDIMARAKLAKTDAEKSALQDEFNNRWHQLFDKPAETESPKMDYAEAVKTLGGMDAALPERELRKKMAQWEEHADDPRAAKMAEAARAVLERRASQGKPKPTEEVEANVESQKKDTNAVETNKKIPQLLGDENNAERFKFGDDVIGFVRIYNPGVTNEKTRDVEGKFLGISSDGKAMIDCGKGGTIKVNPRTLKTPSERKEYNDFTKAQSHAIALRMNEGVIPVKEIDRLQGMTPEEIANAKIEFEKPVAKKPDGKGRMKPVAEEAPRPVEKEHPTPKKTLAVATEPTDEGFKAWAVDSDGKPMAFASDADRAQSRKLFDDLVRRGRVDGKTGANIDAEVQAPAPKAEKVPDGKGKMVAKEIRIGHNNSHTPIRINAINDGRIDMNRMDPNLRSDPKVIAWAKKNGRGVHKDATSGNLMVDVETMREYDRDRAMKAAKMVKRALPGMKVTYHDKPDGVERGQHVIELRDKAGKSLGWFSPKTKEVALLPGADAQTVAHEIGWHAVRDWAKTEAGNGNAAAKKMIDAMHNVENNVPPALRTKVLRLYRNNGVRDRDTLLNEFGAWDFMANGGKALEEAMTSRENQKWYAKALTTMKEAWKDYASAHGMNRADLADVDGMSIDQFKNHLANQLVEGKTFGEVKGPTGNAIDLTESKFDKAKRKISDINAPLQTIVKRIEEKTGKRIASDDSVADENARKVGYQEAAHMEVRSKIDGFRKMLGETGLSKEQVGYYMALKAAAGRDLKIDNRNKAALVESSRKKAHQEIIAKSIRMGRELTASEKKSIYDRYAKDAVKSYKSTNGSAIDPREAAQQIRELENGSLGAEYKKCAKYLRDIINDTLDTQDASGLVDKAESAKWRKEEPEYVPFKSAVSEETGEYFGRGMDLGGLEHKTAEGRKTAAGDIVGHIFEDYQASKLRSIENGVRQKLADLVRANPELGTVEKVGSQDVKERHLSDRIKKNDGGRDNVVLFKENGVPMVIKLEGEIGKAAAAAITGRNLTHVPKWFKTATRISAAMATEYSPTFSVRNWQKDQLALSQIVMAERGAKDGAKWMGHYAVSQKDTHAALWKFVTTGNIDVNTKGGKILKDFIDAGGMIGGYERETFGEVTKALSYDEIQKELKRGSSVSRAVAKHTLNSVAYLNKMSELTSRVNAFEAERRMGTDKDGRTVSDKAAALFARRALVDFNQAGENTGITNALKMFSNSSLGSNVRAFQAATGNRNGPKMLASMMAWGAAQAAINHFANADDKERDKRGEATGKDVGEYDLRTGFLYLRNGDKALKIGQHEDIFTLASYFGNTLTRCALGDITKEQAAKNMGVSVAELAANFTGLGDMNLESREGGATGIAKSVGLYFVPSLLQPAGEIMANQDYAGRQLYMPKVLGDDTPMSEKSRKSTPEYAKTTVKKLNEWSGGNANRSGWIDIPPEVVQKAVEGFGKNALKDVMNIYETGKAILNGEYGELANNLKPVRRDFFKDVPDSTNRYYQRVSELSKDFNEFKKNRPTMTKEEIAEYVSEHPWVRNEDRLNKIIGRVKELMKLESGKVKSGRSWIDRKDAPSKELVEKWKNERLRLQAVLLDQSRDN